MPLILTGTAEKRNPDAGSRSRLHKCSTIGIPAPSRIVCTGRRLSAVSSILNESMPTSTAPEMFQMSGSIFRQERVALEIPVGPPVFVPAGMYQHCLAAYVGIGECRARNSTPVQACSPDQHAREVCERSQFQPARSAQRSTSCRCLGNSTFIAVTPISHAAAADSHAAENTNTKAENFMCRITPRRLHLAQRRTWIPAFPGPIGGCRLHAVRCIHRWNDSGNSPER